MSGIHDLILNFVRDELEEALINDIPVGDPARAGVVKVGPLQGEPDPDEARISVEVYVNDPEQEISGSAIGRVTEVWDDQVDEVEIGGSITWKRRFTVKARCLFDRTGEGLSDAQSIASTVRTRIEKRLLTIRFNGLASDDEYVCRGAFSDSLRGSMVQLGGPPDAYDYMLKVRFDVLTTESTRG